MLQTLYARSRWRPGRLHAHHARTFRGVVWCGESSALKATLQMADSRETNTSCISRGTGRWAHRASQNIPNTRHNRDRRAHHHAQSAVPWTGPTVHCCARHATSTFRTPQCGPVHHRTHLNAAECHICSVHRMIRWHRLISRRCGYLASIPRGIPLQSSAQHSSLERWHAGRQLSAVQRDIERGWRLLLVGLTLA